MTRKRAVLAVLALLASSQRPHAQGTARVYFLDIGQGAGTLIVSPTGKTLLVDGGPSGAGTGKIIPTLNTLDITTIDYTVVTHYHVDHDAGITEVINAGRVAGIAYDNGDASNLIPPNLAGSTGAAYTSYKNAIAAHPAILRQTIEPGTVIDLGGGMRATCLVAGGRLLGGGSIPINNDDLNSESISLLIEYNNFDFLVSGDLTGGGSTASEKTPDVETYTGQLAGDVDVVQLNHHGSTTTSNQRFLSAVKAEAAVAQTGSTNTFGHPNRETVNKYLNTPVTNGHTFLPTTVPAPGVGPVFYSPEQSPAGDDRVTQQGFSGATTAGAGSGTLLLQTDGTSGYSLMSFDDGGVRINPSVHLYPLDTASSGITTDFPPTVVPALSPAVPFATESVLVSAQVDDLNPIAAVSLTYALDGVSQGPVPMVFTGAAYEASIPAQPDGTRVSYTLSAVTATGKATSISSGYFSGTTPISALRAINANGEPLYAGYAARILALTTAGSNTYGSSTNDDYVQDATGGINVYRSTDLVTPFTSTTVGQTVEVRGLVGSIGGRLRLDVSQSTDKKGQPYPYGITSIALGAAPAPTDVSIAQLLEGPEAYEGALISIPNCGIVSGSIPPAPQSFDGVVTVSDGTGTFALKIDHDTDIQGFTPAAAFTLTGIVQQDDYLRPFDAGYNVAPRSRADLGGTVVTAPLLSIADAKADQVQNNAGHAPGADFVPDLLGQGVRVRGTVTSINFRPGGTEYYIQDGTGGIDLFSASAFDALSPGDSVEAFGFVSQFNALTELSLSSVTFLSTGTAPAPQVVTLSQLANGGAGEAFEGLLVQIDNVVVTSGAFPAAGATGNVTIADPTGSLTLRINAATDIDGTPAPTTPFSVVALVGQFDSTPPFDSGYQLLPRSVDDIIPGASVITAAPTPLNFAPVNLGGSAVRSFDITNVGASAVTLSTPFTKSGADGAQFTVGAPGVTTLNPGDTTTASVTFAPTLIGLKTATVSLQSSGGGIAAVALTGAGQVGAGGAGGGVVISEFRVHGPSGGNDEFVEIYNNSDVPIDISGWKLRGSNAAGTIGTRATVPASTSLPARRHYLFTNTAVSGYSGAVPGNLTYTTGITDDGGIAIAQANDTIVDQVGLSATSAFKEGTTLTPLTTNTNRGYERNAGGVEGSQNDSNNNAGDFHLISPNDPQNLNSAPTPTFSASPSVINFGTIAAGATAPATLTVVNNSSAPSPVTVALTVPFAISGPDAGAFAASLPSATSLAAGASTTATITFQPASSGAKTATLTIASANGGTRTVALSGSGALGLTLDTGAIDFGSVPLGGSASASVTITNAAASTITLTPPFVMTGPNAAEFIAGAPSTLVLGPQDVATVPVSVNPATIGAKSASLRISSADGGSPSVSLLASTCPAIAVAPAGLPGGFVGIPYSQTAAASGGVAPYAFAIASGAPPSGLTLAANGLLAGTPAASGSFSFSIKATDAVGCSGTAPYGVAIAIRLTATPGSVSFGSVHVGATATVPVTIKNTSGFAVTLTPPFTITGTDAPQFSIASPGTTTLAASASTTATASFSPTAGGTKSATLNITSSNGGATTVALSGSGDAASAGNGIVISELRFHGPGGGNDEFIELYNSTDLPIDISGYILKESNSAGSTANRVTVAAGAVVPAHGHYLFVNAAAGPPLSALSDQTYGIGIVDNGGVAITLPDDTIVDQVGLSVGSAFKEGTPLVGLGAANLDQGYERKPGGANGSGLDTNNNSTDFQLRAPSNPQNLAGAIAPPLFNVSAVSFGSVPVGTAAAATATITNTSAAPVTLSPPFLLTGAHAAEFTVGPPATTTLPAGSSTTADVTFTPVALNARSATLTLGSTNGGAAIAALSGTGACPTITLSSSLANGAFNAPYSGTITASGGQTPYLFSTTAGALPGGVSLQSNGGVSGTATAAGAFGFTVQATDALGCTGAADASISIARAAVAVSWPSPAAIVYGTPLGAAQLNATTSVPGAFTYSPPAGALLTAGSGQTLSVSFLPDDSANYENGARSVSIDVTQAPLSATAANASREFGAANPAFIGSIAGLVGADHITATYSSTATAASPVGSYPITPVLIDPDGRLPSYAVTIHAGTLSVVDTTAPVLALPSTITAEATGTSTPVSYTATAEDAVDHVVAVHCLPESGAGFPVGTSVVGCSASDNHGNAASGTFAVTVTDHTAPSLSVPAPITVQAPSPGGAAVSFSVLASDLVDGVVPAACAPPSGRTFAVGTTTVSCSATDAHANTAHASFTVTVSPFEPGRMNGDGAIAAGSLRHQFEFHVQDRSNGAESGRIEYRVRSTGHGHRTDDRFESSTITAVIFTDVPGVSPGKRPPSGIDTVSFHGVGKWNGHSGYTFNAQATDAGEPGHGRDRFSIAVRDAAGGVVASVSATLTDGNIQSLRQNH